METVVQKLLRFQVGSSSVLIATLALLTTLVWVNPANAQATTTLKGGVEQNVNPDASEILPRAASSRTPQISVVGWEVDAAGDSATLEYGLPDFWNRRNELRLLARLSGSSEGWKSLDSGLLGGQQSS